MYKLKMTWMYLGLLMAALSLFVLRNYSLPSWAVGLLQGTFVLGLVMSVYGLFKP